MNLAYPSYEFDEAVAAVCHGSVSEEQARNLNSLLRENGAARDEYILRLEIHARLASAPELFAGMGPEAVPPSVVSFDPAGPVGWRRMAWALALAACLALVAGGWWGSRLWNSGEKQETMSQGVAMLNRAVDPVWMPGSEGPRSGAPLEPGWLRLKSGLAQIVFYSGARVVIQGPAELELISQDQVSCKFGRLTAEVPPQARGFRVQTPQMTVTDLGTSFGVVVTDQRTELHVFKGGVELRSSAGQVQQNLREGAGAVIEDGHPLRLVPVNSAGFTPLFDLQPRSEVANTLRYHQWRAASDRLNHDPSLLVHLDFEEDAAPDWRLRNSGNVGFAGTDATMVGCQWTSGRWPDKRALEFQSINDRVRLSVPGEFAALTFATWVRVHGLDRQINSLFMSDGFAPGTVHWSVRTDGVLGLTVIGPEPGNFQIVASPPVLTLDQFGMWLHLAVVLDGDARQVAFYVNGRPVSAQPLRLPPPYRIDGAELGNWNARGFPDHDPFHIRNFSGAMDEFCLFSRALRDDEIGALYAEGKPQPYPEARR